MFNRSFYLLKFLTLPPIKIFHFTVYVLHLSSCKVSVMCFSEQIKKDSKDEGYVTDIILVIVELL